VDEDLLSSKSHDRCCAQQTFCKRHNVHKHGHNDKGKGVENTIQNKIKTWLEELINEFVFYLQSEGKPKWFSQHNDM
jgi:hypothetical protein